MPWKRYTLGFQPAIGNPFLLMKSSQSKQQPTQVALLMQTTLSTHSHIDVVAFSTDFKATQQTWQQTQVLAHAPKPTSPVVEPILHESVFHELVQGQVCKCWQCCDLVLASVAEEQIVFIMKIEAETM